jgi:hypothetical protein
MQKTNDLYEDCVAAGLETDNHESDLYIKESPKARELLKIWGYDSPKRFISPIDGALWLDIPFMYSPWWKKRQAS